MRWWIPIGLVVLALACFWEVGRLQPQLVQQRRDFHLTRGEPLENSPPLVAFTTVAMGGFRGIIADLLWLRASQLQQDGKYFELVQLADWITKLEPRYAQVWAFHGWNMAYNVSVLFSAPVDRWRWVRHGFTLLRDEGLAANPGEANLYRELGWIYQHKLAGNSDQANVYYRREWAAEMRTLFDGPRPDYAACATNATAESVVRMRRDYKLEPQLMEQVEREFGPLDWRLPQAHAIYWAWRGKPYATGFDKLSLERMIFQSMADAFLEGSLFYNPAENVFATMPNLALLPTVQRAYETALAQNTGESSITSAYRNFLKNAIQILYTHHANRQAQATFETLRKLSPSDDTAHGLDYFIYQSFTEFTRDLGQRDALAVVSGALEQSYYWSALGEEERATGFDQLARLIWQRYYDAHSAPEVQERTGLPPLPQLRKQAVEVVRQRLTTSQARERLGPASSLPAPTP